MRLYITKINFYSGALLFKAVVVGIQICYHGLQIASYPISPLHPPLLPPHIILLPSDHNNNLPSTAVMTLDTRVLSGFGARPNVVPIISAEMILLPALGRRCLD